MGLKVHPELWAITEVKAKSECGVCRNASTIVDNLGNAVWRNADRFCQLVLRHSDIQRGIPVSTFRQASQEQTLSSSPSSPSVIVKGISPSDDSSAANEARFVRLNSLSLFDRILHRQYGRLKWRKFGFDDFPNHSIRNRMVFMPKDVPNAGDAAPSDVWMLGRQLIGKVTASFRNDFNRPLSSMAEQPIVLKISKRLTCDSRLYTVDRHHDSCRIGPILRVIRTRVLPISRCHPATSDAGYHES